MKKLSLIVLAAMALLLGACTTQKAQFPVYAWQGVNEKTDLNQLQKDFQYWKSQGWSSSPSNPSVRA